VLHPSLENGGDAGIAAGSYQMRRVFCIGPFTLWILTTILAIEYYFIPVFYYTLDIPIVKSIIPTIAFIIEFVFCEPCAAFVTSPVIIVIVIHDIIP